MTDLTMLSKKDLDDQFRNALESFWDDSPALVPHGASMSSVPIEGSEYARVVAEYQRRGWERPHRLY